MTKRAHWAGWVAAVVLAIAGAGSSATASELAAGKTDHAYRMTLQILGGLPSCGDEFSGPEYYGAATRRDPQVEESLDRIDKELDRLVPRIDAFDERMEPLLPREHNTVPLTDGELRELEALRERSGDLERQIKEMKPGDLAPEQGRALREEKREADKALKRLENSVPLTEEEARFLQDQRKQREPLVERRNVLNTDQKKLRSLISMSTPGSLRVYPNDSVRLRLMEKDAFDDDICATWEVTLDREILDKGGVDLERGDRPLLRLWIQRVSQ
ncbi:MAG: hypothetical protein OXP28_18745 [Gammaproteobacteria bacterium]|nr:hypothetical protein [Gammaproteobacteria bacterium]